MIPHDGHEGDGEVEYGLVVPFIACASQGGEFEDEAFVAGYQVGQIDQQLADGDTTTRMVVEAVADQVDLMAFRHGFQTVRRPRAYGWVEVSFERRMALV